MRRILGSIILLSLSTIILSGCETDSPVAQLAGTSAHAQAAAEDTAERPTRAQAAMDCWAMAEKTMPNSSVDARGDFVTPCIEAKLNGTPVAKPGASARKPKAEAKPKSEAKTEAKTETKPKQDATAEAKPVSEKPKAEKPKAKPKAKPAAKPAEKHESDAEPADAE